MTAITLPRAVVEQALEALEQSHTRAPFGADGVVYWEGVKIHEAAVTALRERLAQPNDFNPDWDAMAVMVEEQQRMAKRIAELEAQPEQKPVAWESFFKRYCPWLEQPEQKPVAVYGYCPQCGAKGVMRERRPNGNDKCANGHTYPSSTSTPPQRTWVDLTDEQIEACRQEGYLHSGLNAPFDFDRAAGAVLAKAKEQNT